jgi:hypothetical protein
VPLAPTKGSVPSLLLPIAISALVSLLLGLPIALFTRRATDGWAAFLAEGLVFGFVLFALAPTLFAWIGVAGLVIFAVVWLAVLILAILRRPGWPQKPTRPTARTWAFIVLAVVIAVIAVLFRLHNDNFLPVLGDMGAYVNWANQFARTGVLSATWPPLLSSFLAVPAAVFGTASTTASLGVAGLVLIVALSRLLGLLNVNRWVILLTAGFATLSVHAIWYSYFPSSEALEAPLFVIWLITVLGIVRARSVVAWVALNAVVMLAMGLTRGTGPFLLLPLGLLAIISLIVPGWRWFAKRVWMVLAAGVAGSALAFWYGITRIHFYYVELQFRDLVPAKVADFVEYKLQAFTPGIPTAIGLLVAVAIVGVIAWRVRTVDESTPAKSSRLPSILGWILTALLVFGIVAAGAVGAGGWQVLYRIGLEFILLAILALVLSNLRRFDTLTTAFVLFVGAIMAMFIGLQTARLATYSAHAFFLYWDRYFVSEVLPCMFILTGITLGAALKFAIAQGWLRPALRSVTAAVAVVAVVLAGFAFTEARNLTLIASDSYLNGAAQYQAKLDSNIPNKKEPVLWTATSAKQYPGFFFPNTWMAFAQPMATSFGYNVKRILNRNNFNPDEVVSAATVENELACSPTASVTVFEVQDGGPNVASRISDPKLTISRVATEKGTISLLREPPKKGGWQYVHFTTDVWKVTAAPGSTLAACDEKDASAAG